MVSSLKFSTRVSHRPGAAVQLAKKQTNELRAALEAVQKSAAESAKQQSAALDQQRMAADAASAEAMTMKRAIDDARKQASMAEQKLEASNQEMRNAQSESSRLLQEIVELLGKRQRDLEDRLKEKRPKKATRAPRESR
jgi:hypothetical protein